MDHSVSQNPATKTLKKTVLLIATFSAFLTAFLSSAINLALPSISKELHATAVQVAWIASSFLLASAVFLIPFGRLADIIGRKKIFTLGISFFSLNSFLVVFCHDIHTLLIIRALQGISASMIFTTGMAIITSVFGPGERGRAMGINVTAVYTGLSAGPVIGGFLTQYFGWRSIFIFVFPLGLICLYLILRKMRNTEWAESANEKFDWKGSVIYGLSLASFMYGFSRLPKPAGWTFLSLGLLLGIAFLFFENRQEKPVFDIRLILRNRVFAFSSIAALIHYSATSAIGFFMSLYLQYIHGLDARSAGLVLISQPLAMALLSPVAGKLSDRKNPGIIASTGMGLTATGLISLCFITQKSPYWLIIALLLVMGIGFALFSSPNANAIMSSVEKRHLGVASGLVATMRNIGQMLSLGIAMMLLAVYIGGREAINPSNYQGLIKGMHTGFFVFSGLCILGIFASLARNNKLKI
jgi:EmrB/QacA subfamily drug resistance transporter